MSVVIDKRLISRSKYSLKAPYSMRVESVVAHNTANDAPAVNEASYASTNNNATGFHYVADNIRIIQIIPDNRNAFHAGDGARGKGNRHGLSVEICYSRSGGKRFTQAEINGAKLIAHLLKKHNLGMRDLKKHQDFSGKYCPHRTLDLGWNRFVSLVRKYFNSSSISAGGGVLYYSTNHNSKHSGVKKLQRDLITLGFDSIEANGVFGAKTEVELKNFQRTNGLTVDGLAGPATRKEIDRMIKQKPSRNYFKMGDEGKKVEKIQRDLIKLGYGVGIMRMNGNFGSTTDKYVKQFQRDNDLKENGAVGPKTFRKIDHRLQAQDIKLYKVQVGEYENREGAEKLLKELKAKGFNGFVKKE